MEPVVLSVPRLSDAELDALATMKRQERAALTRQIVGLWLVNRGGAVLMLALLLLVLAGTVQVTGRFGMVAVVAVGSLVLAVVMTHDGLKRLSDRFCARERAIRFAREGVTYTLASVEDERRRRRAGMVRETREPQPDGSENDPDWYPEGWQSDPGEPFPYRGEKVVLEGGPLDGRTAHMRDDSFSLWVAREPDGELVVRSTRDAPDDVPPAYAKLGRYAYVPEDEVLRWRQDWR